MFSKRIPNLENYQHTTGDAWRWRQAAGTDTQDIVDMAQTHFGLETAGIYENDPIEYSRNVMLAIVNQFYKPRAELVSVARNETTQRLMAYTWAIRGERAPWSREEMIAIRIAHVDQTASTRERVFLCAQMIRMWEKWAGACDIKIIVSSTIRGDQDGFLKLHEAAGFVIRGSIAYKRRSTVLMDVDAGADIQVTGSSSTYIPPKMSDTSDHSIDSQDRRV